VSDVQFRLRPRFSVIFHGPDDVELRYGVWNPVSIHLRDDVQQGVLARLIARLDGCLSTAQIAAAEDVPREQVERLVDHLLERDLLETAATTAIDAYLSSIPTWAADEAFTAPRKAVILPDTDLAPGLVAALVDVLGTDGVRVAGADDGAALDRLSDADTGWLDDGLAAEEGLEVFRRWSGALVVCAATTVDPVRLQVLNRAYLRHRIPWVHAALDGPFVLVGPSFLPGESPCYECLETRVFLNLRESRSYQRYKKALTAARVRLGAPPLIGPLARLLVGHLAVEVTNLALTGSAHTVGKMLALHVPTMEIAFPEVLRVPGCAGCGSKAEVDGEVLHFDALAPRSAR